MRQLSISFDQVCLSNSGQRESDQAKISTVIQGTADADVNDKEVQEKVASGVDYALNKFHTITPDQQRALLDKVHTYAR